MTLTHVLIKAKRMTEDRIEAITEDARIKRLPAAGRWRLELIDLQSLLSGIDDQLARAEFKASIHKNTQP